MRYFLLFVVSLSVSAANGFGAAIPSVYWSEAGGVFRARFDGSGAEPVTAGFELGGLSLDRRYDRLFFSDILPLGGPGPAGGIFRSTSDGLNHAPIITDLPAPTALALDRNAEQVIWADRQLNTISVARYGGGEAQTILASQPSIAQIEGLAFDPWERKLYFSYVNPLIDSLRPGSVVRMNLDGSQLETVVSGLVAPQGVAVDHIRKQVYWADPEFGVGVIGVANFDGSNKLDLITKLDEPRGLAVNPFANQLYWTDAGTGKIQTSHTLFVAPEDVVTDRNEPLAIGLLFRSPLPGDANDDGQVDLDDLNDVRNHFGRVEGAGPGDADRDGDVDLDDLNLVRNQFGTRFVAPPEELTSVPEPNSLAMAVLAVTVVGATWSSAKYAQRKNRHETR